MFRNKWSLVNYAMKAVGTNRNCYNGTERAERRGKLGKKKKLQNIVTLDDLWAVGRHSNWERWLNSLPFWPWHQLLCQQFVQASHAFDKLFQTLGELLVFWILAETQTISVLNLSSLSSNCVFCNYYILLHSVYIFDYFQFIALLVLRHMLPILISGAGEYSLTLFTVSLANPVFCLKWHAVWEHVKQTS